LGVLLEAKGQGLVAAVRPLLDALRDEAGFWLSERLFCQAEGGILEIGSRIYGARTKSVELCLKAILIWSRAV
jgi:hypothetical protein